MSLTKQEAKETLEELGIFLSGWEAPWGTGKGLSNKIKQLEEYIEGLEEEQDEWPQEGDEFYYLMEDGGWAKGEWAKSYDWKLLDIGNIFKSKQEAQDHREWLQARATLVKRIAELNDGWKPDWEDETQAIYGILYDYDDDKFRWEVFYFIQHQPYGLYLKSIKLAKQLIKEYEEELKIYFGIK